MNALRHYNYFWGLFYTFSHFLKAKFLLYFAYPGGKLLINEL